MIDWDAPIRAYCERGDGSFWAEPFGAASNAAFLVASAAAGWRARAARDRVGLAFAGMIAVIGLGSFLFHTLAVQWAMLADVIPIALFVVAYFALALRRFLGLRPAATVPLTLGFAVADIALTPILEAATGLPLARMTNGSLDYLPAFAALLGVAAALAPRDPCTARSLALVALLFLASLAFRTVDRAACDRIPIGTHFLWHALNAAVLYALLILALGRRPRDEDATPCGREGKVAELRATGD